MPVASMVPLPPKPLRLSEAIAWFESRSAGRKVKDRTSDAQIFALKDLQKFLRKTAGIDVWFHAITTDQIGAYLDEVKARPGRRVNEKGERLPAAANTVGKRLMDLRSPFRLILKEKNAALINPLDGLSERLTDLAAQGAEEMESYWPFEEHHLRDLFKPDRYLALTREPDNFWAPLIAAHTGLRLGELTPLTVDDVGQDNMGIWYLTVPVERAKNKNSFRLVPITQPLIELGFLEYVQHVRALGARYLWPQRDYTTKKSISKPSQLQSDRFAKLSTACGVIHPRLVFHSFRHTTVCALLDSGTPPHLSMQICGHEAQDEAVRRGILSESATRSVHFRTYSHADRPRLGAESHLLPMKAALENSLKLPIDYARLKIAAQIVKQHVRAKGGKFAAGWAPQNAKYTEQLKRQLDVCDFETNGARRGDGEPETQISKA